MLTQEDIQLLEALFDKKLEPINNSLDSVETRFDKKLEPINNRLGSIETRFDKKLEPINNSLDSIETNMAEMKESLAEVREAANYLLDLADGKEKAIRKPIGTPKKGTDEYEQSHCNHHHGGRPRHARELYPEKAPNTVNNFISLANKGFYDGLTFHRVIPGFMIQGGCPEGTGMGGPGYEINGEFAANGFRQNDLIHETGVLSMARTMAPNSAGSQFFVMVAPAPHLDGQYAAFGKITEGQDVAIDISRVQRSMMNDKPKKTVVMATVRVDTLGVDYPAPETH